MVRQSRGKDGEYAASTALLRAPQARQPAEGGSFPAAAVGLVWVEGRQ